MSTTAIVIALGGGLLAAAIAVARQRKGPDASGPPAPPDLSALDDAAFRAHVLGEIEAGRKIVAIKLGRERTRLGLAEAKALVEALESGADSVELSLARASVLDDALVGAVRTRNLHQVVLLAAGMDTRAFRIPWPSAVKVFEVDRDEIFDHKEAVLGRAGASPSCDRHIVRAEHRTRIAVCATDDRVNVSLRHVFHRLR
jgi:ribosomal protein L7/L12